jgi:hypothetical protein
VSVHDDERLLGLLGNALRAVDPVPDHVVEGARAAWTWRTIDAELAELVFDSATELTGVRSEDQLRQVTFRAPGIEIEVMVIDDVSRRIVGQLVPAAEMTIELAGSDRVISTRADRLGRFGFDEVLAGPVRLTVLGDAGEPVVHTEWTLL